jgi:hypothetical protein
MDIVKPSEKTVDAPMKLELPAGDPSLPESVGRVRRHHAVPVAMHRPLCNDSVSPVTYHRSSHSELRRTEQGWDRP